MIIRSIVCTLILLTSVAHATPTQPLRRFALVIGMNKWDLMENKASAGGILAGAPRASLDSRRDMRAGCLPWCRSKQR